MDGCAIRASVPRTLHNSPGLCVKSWTGVNAARFPPLTIVTQCQRAEGVEREREGGELADGQSGCK